MTSSKVASAGILMMSCWIAADERLAAAIMQNMRIDRNIALPDPAATVGAIKDRQMFQLRVRRGLPRSSCRSNSRSPPTRLPWA